MSAPSGVEIALANGGVIMNRPVRVVDKPQSPA
jgi:hypothetical protein